MEFICNLLYDTSVLPFSSMFLNKTDFRTSTTDISYRELQMNSIFMHVLNMYLAGKTDANMGTVQVTPCFGDPGLSAYFFICLGDVQVVRFCVMNWRAHS